MCAEIARQESKDPAAIRHLAAFARQRIGAKSNDELLHVCYREGWLGEHTGLLEREAAVAIRERELDEWPEVTPAQRAYLDRFDRMLKTPYGSEAERRARLEMRYMLGAMCIEKGIPVPGARRELEQPVLALAA